MLRINQESSGLLLGAGVCPILRLGYLGRNTTGLARLVTFTDQATHLIEIHRGDQSFERRSQVWRGALRKDGATRVVAPRDPTIQRTSIAVWKR